MISIFIFSEEQSIKSVTGYLEPLGLDKMVMIRPLDALNEEYGPFRMAVQGRKIRVLPDWFGEHLPVLFPQDLSLTKQNLVSLVLYATGATEEALVLTQGMRINRYFQWFGGATCQASGITENLKDHTFCHNRAVLVKSDWQKDEEIKCQCFDLALTLEADLEFRAYTVLQYGQFLREGGKAAKALKILEPFLKQEGLNEACRKALELEYIRCTSSLYEVWEKNELIVHKARVWEVYSFYRDQHATMLEAMLCREMAEVARMEENYRESLSYISKCIHIYMAEQLEEMEAYAHIFKGELLHEWARKDAPEYFIQAAKCFQKALHVFNKGEVPQIFAQAHHRLAQLYVEMPEDQKQGVSWIETSRKSFEEALNYFNKVRFPYEYASVCHDYAAALMIYPDEVRTDNLERAILLLEDALVIRTSEMPKERCLTLLNYLEVRLEVENTKVSMDRTRVIEMQEAALEIINLAPSNRLKTRAAKYLKVIEKALQGVTIQ